MTLKLIQFLLGLLFCAALSRADSLIFPSYQIAVEVIEPKGNPLILNKHQTLLVTLKPQTSLALEVLDFRFDARMPQHKHGMVTKARVQKVGSLQYRVEGVRLHMPGDWLLEFIITNQKGQTRIEVPWVLTAS